MRPVALVGILLSTSILGGCAGTIGGITLSSISSFAGLASTLFTGADLGEHAASLITGKDCRFSEGLMRADRDVCEEPGSLATRDDFHGIFVERIDPDGTVIYAAPKYMPASFGAGEYENKADAIWAAIKTQKVAEENERQLARAQAAQTIDVAALATGSVSSQSLAFLPAGMAVESDVVDGETASQTASRPRTANNAAPQAVAKREVKAPEIEVPIDTNMAAIDEKSFAASVQPSTNGEGGPFIATATSSAPVASTLVNGEPVVVLRLRPIFSATTPTSAEATSATPTETASAESTTMFITQANAQPASATAPSPLAILEQPPARAALPTTMASIEPQLVDARPRAKPAAAPAPVVEAQDKPVKAVRTAAVRTRRVEAVQPDVYQPPARSEAALDAPADVTASAPVQVPGDIPAEHTAIPVTAMAPVTSEPVPPATGGPAPLVPMPQE